MADNGQRDAGGRIVAQRRMAAAAHAAEIEDAPRGARWELWLLAAALCGLAYAGAMRYAGSAVAHWKGRAYATVASVAGAQGLVCAGCSTPVVAAERAPAPTQASPVAAAVAPGATRSVAAVVPLAFPLDPQGVCAARGRAEAARLSSSGAQPGFHSAQLSLVASESYARPAARAAYDVMMACLVDEAADRLCEGEARGLLLSELATYLAAARAQRPSSARAATAPVVAAALSRQIEAGRLQKAHLSVKAGFAAADARELARSLAGAKARRGGCAAI